MREVMHVTVIRSDSQCKYVLLERDLETYKTSAEGSNADTVTYSNIVDLARFDGCLYP